MACCNLPKTVAARQVPDRPTAAAALPPDAPPAPAEFADVAWFDGGEGWVGTDTPQIKADGEGPRRKARLRPFGVERCAVTNQLYGHFVAATGYRTEAERLGWSYVFAPFVADEIKKTAAPVGMPWWRA